MIRISDALLILAVIGGAVWTFQIKHEAEVSARQLRALKKDIAAQNNKIVLLEADWALLTSPQRLETVANAYSDELNLQVLDAAQIATLDSLPPLREVPLTESMEVDAGSSIDTMLKTGSVSPQFAPSKITTPKRPKRARKRSEAKPTGRGIADLIATNEDTDGADQ